MSAKISIVLPVYNVERYLVRCLQSIIEQTEKNWVCIIVDDGSTDNSGSICDKYHQNDERFIVYHIENSGVSCARQYGMSKVKTPYFIHIDGDDWAEKTWLEDLLKSILDNSSDIAVCDFSVYTKKGTYYRKQNDCKDLLASILKGKNMGALWNKLIKSKYAVGYAKFPENIDYCEDVSYLSQILPSVGKISYVHKSLYNYNKLNDNSITNNYTHETYGKRKKYIDFLKQSLGESYKDSIKYVQAEIIVEAFSAGVLVVEDIPKINFSLIHYILSKRMSKKNKARLILSLFTHQIL